MTQIGNHRWSSCQKSKLKTRNMVAIERLCRWLSHRSGGEKACATDCVYGSVSAGSLAESAQWLRSLERNQVELAFCNSARTLVTSHPSFAAASRGCVPCQVFVYAKLVGRYLGALSIQPTLRLGRLGRASRRGLQPLCRNGQVRHSAGLVYS